MQVEIKFLDLPVEGGSVTFDFPDLKQEILIIKKGGRFMVYSSFCPHFGGPLELKGDRLHCYFHDYEFSLTDGKCLNRDTSVKCSLFNFSIIEDGICVDIT